MNISRTIKSIALLTLVSSIAYVDARRQAKKSSPQTESASSAVKEAASVKEFDALVEGKAPLVVKFYLPTCGHCKSIKKPFEDLAQTYGAHEAVFVAVNDSKLGVIAETYGISIEGYPTFVLIKDKKVAHTQLGGLINAQNIQQHLGVTAQ